MLRFCLPPFRIVSWLNLLGVDQVRVRGPQTASASGAIRPRGCITGLCDSRHSWTGRIDLSLSPVSGVTSHSESIAPGYRPYWQYLAFGAILALAAYFGAHTKGEPWHSPTRSTIIFPLAVVGICAIFRLFRIGRWVTPLSQELKAEEAPYSSQLERVAWPLAGFLGVTAALLLLERAYPFYFTQDDNLDSFLPVMLHGCRSFFNGVFPEWDPYQFMGSPTTVLGYYGFTYPPTYLSYWFAKTILRQPNAMIDVLAFIHLLIGYFAFYWLMRREQCRPSIATLAAGAYALSGYALIFSRSFIQFSPVMLWAPLLLVCLQALLRGKTGWGWILGFGTCIGLLFHAGHIQMWAYDILMTDFAILLLLLTGRIGFLAFVRCAAAHMIGLAIAAPLLIPELIVARDSNRYPDSTGILTGLKGLFIPDTVSPSPHPVGWGVGYPIGEMYYSGTLFMLLAAILLLSLLAMRWNRFTARANVWFLCAVLAFVLALGSRGILWTGLVHLPGFDHFRFPFKFLAFLDLFGTVAGALALERLMRRQHWGIGVELPLVLVMGGVLAYHCTLATASFFNYPFAPYPAPDPWIVQRLLPRGDRYYPKLVPAETLPDGTAVMMGGDGNRSAKDPRYLDSFMNQWPTLQEVFSVHGYDPLVYDSPIVKHMVMNTIRSTQEGLAAYGVKYLLQYTPPGVRGVILPLGWQGTQLVYVNDRVRVYELPYSYPMSFPEDEPGNALPVKFDAAGATIDTSALSHGGPVILNMLWRAEYRATSNGVRLTTDADDWGRIRVHVLNAASVRLAYLPPWGTGWMVAGVLFLAGISVGWWSNRLSQEIGGGRSL